MDLQPVGWGDEVEIARMPIAFNRDSLRSEIPNRHNVPPEDLRSDTPFGKRATGRNDHPSCRSRPPGRPYFFSRITGLDLAIPGTEGTSHQPTPWHCPPYPMHHTGSRPEGHFQPGVNDRCPRRRYWPSLDQIDSPRETPFHRCREPSFPTPPRSEVSFDASGSTGLPQTSSHWSPDNFRIPWEKLR